MRSQFVRSGVVMRSVSVRLLAFTFVLAGFGPFAQAAILHVPSEQATIQSAINVAANGDTVLIAPGTYFENINFYGKAITVTSEQGPAGTIIDGGSAGPVVTFAASESTQSVLSGLTLQHGQASSAAYNGGGIRIQNASPTISGNVITNNTAGSNGGGISVQSGSPVITNNTIANNGQIPGWTGGVGGGLYISGTGAALVIGNTIANNLETDGSGGAIGINASSPVIQRNIIRGNSAYSQGGAIYIINNSSASVVENLIVNNAGGTGGGVYWLVPSGGGPPSLVSNTFSGNSASTQGSAVYASGFGSSARLIDNVIVSSAGASALYCDGTYSSAPPIVKANDVFATVGAAYAGYCNSLTGTSGNISVDPKFRNPGADDYHLLSASPVIDAGISDPSLLSTDLDGNVRVQDGDNNGTAVVDMGAYEAPAAPDVTAPVTTASANPLANPTGWNTTNVGVTLSATDNTGGTGVKQIQYTLSGADQHIVSGAIALLNFTTEGIVNLSYGATDNAGNTEVAKTLAIRIDKTAPVISGMPAPSCTLSPAKHQMVTVATVTGTDALSGLGSLNVSATSNERDSGTGGGDVPGDIVITGGTVQLRAERAPNGSGRTYTIKASAVDLAGNVSTATASCFVPK